MALKIEKRGAGMTTGDLATPKPSLCHTCKVRKPGLFDIDPNGNPRCADCARAVGQPIPGSEVEPRGLMAPIKTYYLECPDACSLKPGSKVGQKVTEAMLAGVKYRDIVTLVKNEDDWTLYPGTMTRHKKHITVTGVTAADETVRSNATNIEILETIIQKGFANSKNWKPTIADTMKAMDMWFRLTQGNPFDELLDTLASAALGEEETNLDATGTADEVTTAMVTEPEDEEVEQTAVA